MYVSTEGALKCIGGIQMCFRVDIGLPHFKNDYSYAK